MSGAVSLAALLALPLLFAAGMVMFDTANSLLVSRLYWTTEQNDVRRVGFNVAMTAVTAAIGLVIGAVYLAGVLSERTPFAALSGIASVSDHFEALGFLLVGVYLVVWVVTLAPMRRRLTAGVPSTAAGKAV